MTGWETLSPIVAVAHSCKASIAINKDQRPRVNLSFSEPFYREMGEPKVLQVLAGSGENLGKIKLLIGEGPFLLREMEKGGGRFQIPLPEGISARVRETEPCVVVEKHLGEEDQALPIGFERYVIIALPLDAWHKQGAPSHQATARVIAPTPPVATSHQNGKPADVLDAAAYLNRKGMKAQRLAGDWWNIKGEKTPRSEVLREVNRFRKLENLDPLGVQEID